MECKLRLRNNVTASAERGQSLRDTKSMCEDPLFSSFVCILCRVKRRWCMYGRYGLFMYSLECYYGGYFHDYFAFREINTKIPLRWAHTSFTSSVHASFSINSLQWRQNRRDNVSNHQPHDCLLNRLFWRRSKKTLKLRVTGLCVGNSPGTGEFPALRASNAKKVSIWWRYHFFNTTQLC